MSILDKIKGGAENEAETLRVELRKFDNLSDMLDYLQARYDLKNVKPNVLEKPIVVDGLVKVYNNFKPLRK